MEPNKNENEVPRKNLVLIGICTFLAISAFSYCRQHSFESGMDKTLISIDGTDYKVLTPEESEIDRETIEALLNDPETKKFLEDTRE